MMVSCYRRYFYNVVAKSCLRMKLASGNKVSSVIDFKKHYGKWPWGIGTSGNHKIEIIKHNCMANEIIYNLLFVFFLLLIIVTQTAKDFIFTANQKIPPLILL